MSEQRRVTLSREQRDEINRVNGGGGSGAWDALSDLVAAWDAAEPLAYTTEDILGMHAERLDALESRVHALEHPSFACPACDGTGLRASYEGCGTRVNCHARRGTGRAT